jgi:hypothetical protein
VEKLGLLGYQSFLEWRLMAFLLLIFMWFLSILPSVTVI